MAIGVDSPKRRVYYSYMMQRLEDEEDPAVELDDGLLESDRVHYDAKPPEAQAPSRWKTRLLIIGVIIFAVANGVMAWQIFASGPPAAEQQQVLVPTNWRAPRAASPTPRAGAATGIADGKIYAVGGYSDSVLATKTVEFFDPITETWSEGPALPVALADAAAVTYKNNLYVLGGYDAGGKPVASVYVLKSGQWQTAVSLPKALSAPAIAVVGDRIIVAGGFDGKASTDLVYSYSDADKSWREEVHLSSARNGASAAAVANKFYIFGGISNHAPLATAEVYDPATKAWSELPNMPTARLATATAVVQQKIYVIGGQDKENAVDAVEVFNPTTKTWSNAPSLSSPVFGPGAATMNNHIYVLLGGVYGGQFSGSVQILSFQAKQ